MKYAWKSVLRKKDPERIMDFVVFASYMAGKLETMMPVDEGRAAYQRIKKLLTPTTKSV